MRAVLIFLQPQLIGMRVDIFGDNEGARGIANNPPSGAPRSSKHIDVKLHVSLGFIRAAAVCVLHVGTAEQHADAPAKTLWRKFLLHRAPLKNLPGGSSWNA